MQSELQTALFQAFDTLNLQRVKTFSVPPVSSEMTVVRMLARNRKSTMTTKIPPSNNDF